ncbi:MAG TPA: cytochrome c biogenesis protein CcsA [Bryobacteraceae bacterium]|nr:cytochrome c biogenesis protein CcsA [Bryobacteraceae bacterium]
MREKIIYIIAALAAVLLVRNLYVIFLSLPDEAQQGPIYRILFIHLPSAITCFAGFLVAGISSAIYLGTKNLRYDAIAVSATEVGLAFATVVLVTGSIWARIIWGIWWTWDARLTSMLVCWLIYASYLMLRGAIGEPTQRARFSAVLSIFAFTDVIIVWKSIEWWRTQHPGPVLSIRTGGGRIDPAMESAIYWNVLALMLFAIVLVMTRIRQEEARREIHGMRQAAHAL